MSLPLTPLVTDIQWPPWLKMGPAPKKRNGQSTWGLPMHMGGVRQAARCPYGAAEPSWAMVRCISSSHPPILYTSCVGLLQLLTHNQLGHSARIARNRRSTAGRNPSSQFPRLALAISAEAHQRRGVNVILRISVTANFAARIHTQIVAATRRSAQLLFGKHCRCREVIPLFLRVKWMPTPAICLIFKAIVSFLM